MLFDLSGKHGTPADLVDLEQYFAESSQETSSQEEIGISISPSVNEIGNKLSSAPSTTSGQEAECRRLAERFAAAKRNAYRRQLRLRVPTVLGGSIFLFVASLLTITTDHFSLWHITTTLLSCISTYLILLALLPTDTRAVPYFCVLVFTPALFSIVARSTFRILLHVNNFRKSNCIFWGAVAPCWFTYCSIAEYAISIIVAGVCFVGHMQGLKARLSSRALLSRCWTIAGWTILSNAATNLILAILALPAALVVHSLFLFAFGTIFSIFGSLMLMDMDLHSRIQSWFMSRSESTITAAGVAELLGARNIDDLLVAARSSFKFVRADRVAYADMEESHPNPNLVAMTEKGRFGFVDAFVSHSWHDDPRKKWIALQNLRDEFKGRISREPKLWIDKYSIDQNNIDLSLASLPVYLAGCSQLWILCGPTYLERLWCIVEIYVFLEMGGLKSNLHVKLLDDGEQMLDLVSQFDPRKARCVSEGDTDKLQQVIETTGCEQISDLIKSIFLQKRQSADLP